jgi:hypothetical protein
MNGFHLRVLSFLPFAGASGLDREGAGTIDGSRRDNEADNRFRFRVGANVELVENIDRGVREQIAFLFIERHFGGLCRRCNSHMNREQRPGQRFDSAL